jgi:hypothetical protein
MIRRCNDLDFETVWSIINDGAQAYKGVIPAARRTEPYMLFFRRIFLPETTGDSLSPRCSVCERVAAKIELREVSGSWYLRYSGPGGSNGNGDRISVERAQVIRDAFAHPYERTKIRVAGFYDDAGFCIDCGKFYCPTHWNISSTGGGTCPAGHFKSLDPHWSPE